MNSTKLVFLSAVAVAAACSNGNNNGDGGSDAAGDSSANTFTQTGQIIDFDNKSGVYDVMVNGAGATATTDGMGNYTLAVPQNTPYTMQVVAGADAGKAYTSLDEQEWKLAGNANRGKTSFVSSATQGLLQTLLQPKPDPTLAVLSVEVIATGTCAADAGGADVTGATISVPGLATDGGSGPVLVYFSGGLPSSSSTSVTAGQLPAAIIYNMTPTAAFSQVTVTHPTCKQKAFPVNDLSDSNIVYTGNVKLEISYPNGAPAVVSFMRVFLE